MHGTERGKSTFFNWGTQVSYFYWQLIFDRLFIKKINSFSFMLDVWRANSAKNQPANMENMTQKLVDVHDRKKSTFFLRIILTSIKTIWIECIWEFHFQIFCNDMKGASILRMMNYWIVFFQFPDFETPMNYAF